MNPILKLLRARCASRSSVAALLAAEKARGDGADAAAVMTPNNGHHAICAAATRTAQSS